VFLYYGINLCADRHIQEYTAVCFVCLFGVAETVVVSESLASDFTRFSQHILREVYHLVDKYTFLIGLGCGHHMST